MQPVTRFAPSPTGPLHLGHAWSAVRAHDFARQSGGTFLLRIEDIDPTRARAEHVDSILEDLTWLGLDWDGPILWQSDRLDLYAEALETLKRAGLVYPCFCTRAEIAAEITASAAAPHDGEADASLYPGTCRHLAQTERARRCAAEPHAWRLDAAAARDQTGPVDWEEQGSRIPAAPAMFGDVILARKDAPASYHLAVTVDDADQGVTDVIRGRDLFASTHVHRLLQALLSLSAPRYHHHPLVVEVSGRRLAKRHGVASLADLRAAGLEGHAVASQLRAGQLPDGYSLAQG